MKKILITGAAGFIGSNIARALNFEYGYGVVGVDDLSFGDMANVPKGIEFYEQGFETLGDCNEYDVIIHCATSNIIYAMDHPVETFRNNAHNTVEFFRKNQMPKIIYTSTSSVYGNAEQIPTPEDAELKSSNSYDISKRIAEVFLQQRGNYTTFRLSNVYGNKQLASNPYCGVIGKLVFANLNKSIFNIYGNGECTRDYTFISDVVEAVKKAVALPGLQTEVNIGTGVETSIIALYRLVQNITGSMQLLSDNPPRKIDKITRRKLDIRKAAQLLDWKPTITIEEGLKRTIDWYAEHLDNIQKQVSVPSGSIPQ
jgi:UDP-glucose 4-epimerase